MSHASLCCPRRHPLGRRAVFFATLVAGFGTITFPTSGSPAAQTAFLTGVKALHNFQFDEAAEAFRAAQQADNTFAMAYWGEAMSYNHPLWAQQDIEAATKGSRGSTQLPPDARRKRSSPKEKAYFEAIHLLYFGPGDKLARDQAYSQAMARMYAQWPDDHEVAVLYALSLLGTVRPGDTGFRRQALAASIAQSIFQQNPKHPGAAHFVIHAFDDPDHAPLGLAAARAYATIAPSAAHALHMPSHIFVQLGMWQDAAAVEHRGAQGSRRTQHAPEAPGRSRGLPHAVVARVCQCDARQTGGREEERRGGQGSCRKESDEPRSARRVSRDARPLHF